MLQELADKMLEMITIVSEDIQREIITCLPEVVEDSEHSHVATSLRYNHYNQVQLHHTQVQSSFTGIVALEQDNHLV